MEGALAGAVGGVVGSVILPVALVAAVAALGIGAYKYLSEEKAALTPTIAEQILEMARKRKEEQETITVGPDDYDILDKDGNVIYEGGGGSKNNNNDDNNGEEKLTPANPEQGNGGSSSENVPDAVEGSKTGKIWIGNDKYVPELANAIEARFPGQIKAVERVIFDANGNRITDLDIELEKIIIQVKSGSAKGLTRQMINTANATGKTVISYTPDQLLSSAVLRDVRSKGFKTFVDMESLLKCNCSAPR